MNEAQAAPGLVPPPAALVTRLAPWVKAMQRESGADFRALYLYGSALTPRFVAEQSDVNLLLVLAELSFERLETLARSVWALQKASPGVKKVVPLVLTEAQIRRSADVFPAEFLDLVGRRALLAGHDTLAGLDVGLHNLRHQCEYELRSKLIGLRQAYLLAGEGPGTAQRLLVQAAGGLAAVLRQLLVLAVETPPDDADALVSAVAQRYNVDSTALGAPFAARRRPDADSAGAAAQFAALLVALEALIGAVDAYPAR